VVYFRTKISSAGTFRKAFEWKFLKSWDHLVYYNTIIYMIPILHQENLATLSAGWPDSPTAWLSTLGSFALKLHKEPKLLDYVLLSSVTVMY
jgi:hypothetical protein